MLAVIVGASSYAAITHGTSDIIEGYHEYEYGNAGDTESVTENYIRDYVYGGRVEYDSVTKLGTAGCSIYLTGVAGYTYSVTYGIPIWQGEVIQGGTALTSGAVDYLVTDHVKDMDINSWVKAYSGKVVASAFCMTSEAAITNKLIPVIQRANTVGIVGSSRSITEIATQDTASIGNSAKSAETVNTGGNFSILDKAKQIANDVKNNNGVPPKGYKGGRTYKNIPLENGAQKLPEGVNYREYDINPYVKGKNQGTERIVIGDDGSVWYTNDHYFTFTQIE